MMVWKNTNKAAYMKIDDDEFGSWRSMEYNIDKPLEERWGWRWTDEQVYQFYNPIMIFYRVIQIET